MKRLVLASGGVKDVDHAGPCVRHQNVPLRVHVDTVWRQDGSCVVVQAHNEADSALEPGGFAGHVARTANLPSPFRQGMRSGQRRWLRRLSPGRRCAGCPQAAAHSQAKKPVASLQSRDELRHGPRQDHQKALKYR